MNENIHMETIFTGVDEWEYKCSQCGYRTFFLGEACPKCFPEKKEVEKCCNRDHNNDGDCDVHKTKAAKDFFGREIKVGDEVAFMKVGYRHLLLGIVKSIGPKKVTITRTSLNYKSQTMQFHNQVIVKV